MRNSLAGVGVSKSAAADLARSASAVARRVDLVADGHARRGIGGQVDIHARAEADESVALAAREPVAACRRSTGCGARSGRRSARRSRRAPLALDLQRALRSFSMEALSSVGVDEAARVIPLVLDDPVDAGSGSSAR